MRPVRARQIEGSPRDPVSPVLGLIGDPLLWLLCILIRDNVKERRILSIDDGGAPVLVVIGALAIEQGLIKTKCVDIAITIGILDKRSPIAHHRIVGAMPITIEFAYT
jgi:hypothetical protein